MKGFIKLYLKEMKAGRASLAAHAAVAATLAVLIMLFLRTMPQVSPVPQEIVMLLWMSQFFPLVFLWLALISYFGLSQEWRDGSVALWAALPVPRWKLLASKLAFLLSTLVLTVLIMLVVFKLVNLTGLFASAMEELSLTTWYNLLMQSLFCLPVIPAAFAFFLSGVSLRRSPWLSQIPVLAALFGTVLLTERLASLTVLGAERWVIFPVSHWAGMYAAGILGFCLSIYFLDRQALP